MTLPAAPNPLSIGDINAEVGDSFTTQHGLDWVFEITRPVERPGGTGYTPVTITDNVNGGTVDIAGADLNHYRNESLFGYSYETNNTQGGPYGWAYYNNNFRNSNCNNTNCPNCGGSNCGNIGGDNCTTTPLSDCVVADSQSWLQGNCNCACTFNCNAVQYSHNCNCDCPWLCACACW